MSKRPKLEGFSILRPTSYSFERSHTAPRLYVPADDDLDDIAFSDDAAAQDGDPSQTAEGIKAEDEEIDPLEAFMAEIQEEIRAPPPQPKPEGLRLGVSDDEDDPVESFLRAKKDAGLALAADAMNVGYNSIADDT